MPTSVLRHDVTARLTAFAWDSWSQLGVFAPSNRRDRVAVDPEALLLLTLEVGRSDPRLFDETLDWVLANGRLISIQRLHNLCRDDDDRDLVDGMLLWVARHDPRFRPATTRRKRQPQAKPPRPLFYEVARDVRDPDEGFHAAGFLKPTTRPTGKSRPPDLDAPISFAFRMRQLFGLGTRAEILRYLVTGPDADASALAIADAAAYAKRNINDTLASLVASKVVAAYERGNERRYKIDRATWGWFLDLDRIGWPSYRDWPRLLGVLRQLSRWLADPALEGLTPYMRASNARTVVERLAPDMAAVGLQPDRGPTLRGDEYWDTFADFVRGSLAVLDHGSVRPGGGADAFGVVQPAPDS